MIDKYNNDKYNFYGGNICSTHPYSEYYNSYFKRGIRFQSRRRVTEILAKKICSPSPTFNCVGPGAVGTGSLAGMRVLNLLKKDINIWPFNNPENSKSTLVEIFPTFYFKSCQIKPEKDFGYSIEKINVGLKVYGAKPISKKIRFYGPDQDEADALISVAAMKFFSKIKRSWKVPIESKKRRMDIWCATRTLI